MYLLKSTLKENARNIHISSKVNLEHKIQHAVIIRANTSHGMKISTFFEKKLDDDVIRVQCPFN